MPSSVASALRQGVSRLSDLRVRRDVMEKRRQICAHSRPIVGIFNEDARSWATIPASQQICLESERLLGATLR